jgi:hypothetical protein
MGADRTDSEQFSGVASEQDGFATNVPEQHPAFWYVFQRNALAEVRAARA